jgi:hypothetical protein
MFDTLLNSKFYNKWYMKIDLFVVRFHGSWVALVPVLVGFVLAVAVPRMSLLGFFGLLVGFLR